MLGLAMVGLLNVALGGAIGSDGFELATPTPSSAFALAAELELKVPEVEPVALHLAQLGAATSIQRDDLSRLGKSGGLVARLNGVACYLTRPPGMPLTPTDRAPRAPSFFVTITLGSCRG